MRETIDGVSVIRTWLVPARELGVRRFISYASFVASSWLPCIKEASSADLLVCEVPPPTVGFAGLIAARATGRPFILNMADLWPDWPTRAGMLKPGAASFLLRELGGFLYRRATLISCVTRGLLEDLRLKYGVPAAKLLYLPNGVDTELFRPVGPVIQDGIKLFVYAGNHGVYNWPIVIAQAAKLLAVKRPDVRFLLVGDGSQKREVAAYCREHGLTNVSLMDPVPLARVASLFSEAYAALVTYKRGFPSRPAKLLPAMASALPIIYSGEGEGAELVRQARCGLVVPPENPFALAEAVEWISDHPSAAREYGLAGAHLARSEYSWDSLVASWLKQLGERL